MVTDDRCFDCCHRNAIDETCLAMNDPIPIIEMRSVGECGPTARLFDSPGLDDMETAYY